MISVVGKRRKPKRSGRGTQAGSPRKAPPVVTAQATGRASRAIASGPLGSPEQSGRPLVTDRVTYVVEPVYPESDPRHSLTSGAVGRPGRYRVTYVLAVPGRKVVQESVDFHDAVERGDSLLAVNPEVHELRIDFSSAPGTGNGPRVVVRPNAEHRLRDLAVELDATSFNDAARAGYDLVMPILSRWAYLHNVAITTSGTLTEELATGTVSFQSTVIGAVKGFSNSSGGSTPEHRLLLAAYREGLSSRLTLSSVAPVCTAVASTSSSASEITVRAERSPARGPRSGSGPLPSRCCRSPRTPPPIRASPRALV